MCRYVLYCTIYLYSRWFVFPRLEVDSKVQAQHHETKFRRNFGRSWIFNGKSNLCSRLHRGKYVLNMPYQANIKLENLDKSYLRIFFRKPDILKCRLSQIFIQSL